MRLASVYEMPFVAVPLLYVLLSEREPHQSISHKGMPSMAEHVRFVESRPYRRWHLIVNDEFAEGVSPAVGAVYLSRSNEIGIGVLRVFRGHGYGRWAVQQLLKEHAGERLLANISPANEASIKLFKSLGFGLIQHTYAHE